MYRICKNEITCIIRLLVKFKSQHIKNKKIIFINLIKSLFLDAILKQLHVSYFM